jgi:hypothetical protein
MNLMLTRVQASKLGLYFTNLLALQIVFYYFISVCYP